MREDLIAKAVAFAAQHHAGQTYGEDFYIWHPIEVALSVRSKGYPEHLVIAALLHDTVEDTGASIEEVEAEFGAEVAQLVSSLTHDPEVPYADYISGLPNDALPVKLADTLVNYNGLSKMADKDRANKLTERYLLNIVTLVNRMAKGRDMPKFTDQERFALNWARRKYPDGWAGKVSA